jgi:hypothetical protein
VTINIYYTLHKHGRAKENDAERREIYSQRTYFSVSKDNAVA